MIHYDRSSSIIIFSAGYNFHHLPFRYIYSILQDIVTEWSPTGLSLPNKDINESHIILHQVVSFFYIILLFLFI